MRNREPRRRFEAKPAEMVELRGPTPRLPLLRAYLLGTILAAGALLLAGCGTAPACRAGSTGLAGAAGGAALGAIGGNAGLGALVGGLTGAAAGGLTSPNQLYAGPSPLCY
jgi:osmotically inducible lipoprotein OsmB